MKSFRWTAVFILAIALLVAFTVFDYKRSSQNEERKEEARYVLKMKLTDIAHVELITRTMTTVLDRKEDIWQVMAGSFHDLADKTTVESFLSSLESEKTLQSVAEGDAIRWANFGLAEPLLRLKVSNGAGKTEEIKIGSVRAYDASLYARIDETKTVWSLENSWDSFFAKTANDFRDKHVLRTALAPADLKRLLIRAADGATTELVKSGAQWNLSKGGLPFPISETRVNAYLDLIKGLRAKTFTTAAANVPKPELEIRLFNDKSEPVLLARFARGIPPPRLDPKRPPLPEVDVGWSSNLSDGFDIMRPLVDGVRKNAQDFYDRNLPFQFKASDVNQIVVEASGLLSAKFARKGEAWQAIDAKPGQTVDSKKLDEVVAKLGRIEAVRVLAPIRRGEIPAALRQPSRVTLLDSTGHTVFELRWGGIVLDHASSGPEIHFHPARTDKSDYLIAVTDGEIKGLELTSLFSAPAQTPTPVAGAISK